MDKAIIERDVTLTACMLLLNETTVAAPSSVGKGSAKIALRLAAVVPMTRRLSILYAGGWRRSDFLKRKKFTKGRFRFLR